MLTNKLAKIKHGATQRHGMNKTMRAILGGCAFVYKCGTLVVHKNAASQQTQRRAQHAIADSTFW